MADAATRARELLESATPGPWEVQGDYGIWSEAAGVWVMQDDCPPGGTLGCGDAELIAAAPTLLAELADEVNRLRALTTVDDAMVERAAEEIFDRPFPKMPNGTEMRDIARAALEAALGVES